MDRENIKEKIKIYWDEKQTTDHNIAFNDDGAFGIIDQIFDHFEAKDKELQETKEASALLITKYLSEIVELKNQLNIMERASEYWKKSFSEAINKQGSLHIEIVELKDQLKVYCNREVGAITQITSEECKSLKEEWIQLTRDNIERLVSEPITAMTYKSREGNPHTVELVAYGIYLPYKTKRENIHIEGDRVAIYLIEGKWRVKDVDAFHAEYEIEIRESKCL